MAKKGCADLRVDLFSGTFVVEYSYLRGINGTCVLPLCELLEEQAGSQQFSMIASDNNTTHL